MGNKKKRKNSNYKKADLQNSIQNDKEQKKQQASEAARKLKRAKIIDRTVTIALTILFLYFLAQTLL